MNDARPGRLGRRDFLTGAAGLALAFPCGAGAQPQGGTLTYASTALPPNIEPDMQGLDIWQQRWADLTEFEIILPLYPWLDPIWPFRGWDASHPTQSLPWYDAYNAAKHDRESHFDKALPRVIDQCRSAPVQDPPHALSAHACHMATWAI